MMSFEEKQFVKSLETRSNRDGMTISLYYIYTTFERSTGKKISVNTID